MRAGQPHDVDEVTRLVLAPNPSPMTLQGTNTWLLAAPSHGAVVVVDPGPDLPEHRRAVEDAIGGADVAAVVITHHHHDHAEAAGWARDWGAPLRAFDPALVPGADPLPDGRRLEAAGLTLEAVHTPGHASDHLCLRVVETDVVLTGDHVLGEGTTVVAWPDGDLPAYLASLERVRALAPRRLYPGHGPVVDAPAALIDHYLTHRHDRERQVLAALDAGADSPAAIVRTVYADVPAVLHPAAELSVKAHLAKLVAEGRVAADILEGESVGPIDPSRVTDR